MSVETALQDVQVNITPIPDGEVWVQVTGQTGTPDLPTLREHLPPDVAHLPLMRYIPGSAVAGQWALEDWWILGILDEKGGHHNTC